MYLQRNQQDEERKPQQPGVAPGGEVALSSAPAGGTPSAQPVAGAQPAAPAQPQQVGGFSGIRAFLDANKPQGAQMAQQLGRRVEGDINSAKNAQDSYTGQWSDKAWGSARKGYDAFAAQQTQDLQAAKDWWHPKGSMSTGSPAEKARDEEYRRRVADINGRSFKPTVEAYAPDLSQAANAGTELSALKSGTGAAAILGQGQGAGYSPGMASLDAALMEPSLGAVQGDLSSRYGGILSALATPTPPTAPTEEDFKDPAKRSGLPKGR